MTTQTRESRYDAFCKELIDLCRRHGVHLSPGERGQVWADDACAARVLDHINLLNCLSDDPSPMTLEIMRLQRQADAK